mmetsp:Transcript_4423/g.7105  ORF Transcript_4423/g.7105 Transcript_4423/m.7105 type:complete len:412 (-) Transcript_4423:1209-2444(-)
MRSFLILSLALLSADSSTSVAPSSPQRLSPLAFSLAPNVLRTSAPQPTSALGPQSRRARAISGLRMTGTLKPKHSAAEELMHTWNEAWNRHDSMVFEEVSKPMSERWQAHDFAFFSYLHNHLIADPWKAHKPASAKPFASTQLQGLVAQLARAWNDHDSAVFGYLFEGGLDRDWAQHDQALYSAIFGNQGAQVAQPNELLRQLQGAWNAHDSALYALLFEGGLERAWGTHDEALYSAIFGNQPAPAIQPVPAPEPSALLRQLEAAWNAHDSALFAMLFEGGLERAWATHDDALYSALFANQAVQQTVPNGLLGELEEAWNAHDSALFAMLFEGGLDRAWETHDEALYAALFGGEQNSKVPVRGQVKRAARRLQDMSKSVLGDLGNGPDDGYYETGVPGLSYSYSTVTIHRD